MWYKLKRATIRVNGVEKQVRPTTSIYEISYDLRDGTLAWLEAAWFTWIYTNWGYAFDANWLYQTSSSNDRGTSVYKDGLDLSNATKITIQSLGYWERWSWTNDKYVWISTTQNTNPGLIGRIRLNTNTWSKDWGIGYYNASWTMTLSNITQQDRYSWDTTMTLVIDLENKVIDYNISGANVNSWTLSITDAIVAEIRSMQYIYLWWNRWYHSFDANERLKEVYIKIES